MEIIFYFAFAILGILLVSLSVGAIRVKNYWPTVIFIGLTLFFIVIGFPILRNQRINQWIKGDCYDDKPMKYYTVAIARNNPRAMFRLAERYRIKGKYNLADKWYLKAAENNDGLAQLYLAKNFKSDSKYEEAIKWYSKAIENGVNEQSSLAFCQYKMGEKYEKGAGVQQSYTEAVKWYRKAIESGSTGALTALALCYEMGRGVRQSTAEAVKLYNRAHEKSKKNWSYTPPMPAIAETQYQLAIAISNQNATSEDWKWAVALYREAMNKGHLQAQERLAWCYENGKGIAQSDDQAAELYFKVLQQNINATPTSAEVKYRIALKYDELKSYTGAATWYRKAAEQGHAGAQNNLGTQYANGQGVAQSWHEAVKWYRKAAEQGYMWAQCNLGWRYFYGQGVSQSYDGAIRWFKESAKQNHKWAYMALGYCYKEGKGVEQNDFNAIEYYEEAAAQDVVKAMLELGKLYEKGWHRGYWQKAVKWYCEAAEKGDQEAQYWMGIYFDRGHGSGLHNHSLGDALKWYRKAAEQGHSGAKQRLQELGE
ncbi:MAG: SEL1-like repeat protein [Kiritimatiellae bacterium]|nr:SEL1-like repeat protein [Kiritimatiellia bacterium]